MTIPQDDKRITPPDEVFLAYEEFAADERKKQKNEFARSLITAKSAMQHVLRSEMTRMGYLKGNGGERR
jgi:hypothetical protein